MDGGHGAAAAPGKRRVINTDLAGKRYATLQPPSGALAASRFWPLKNLEMVELVR